MLRYSPEQPLLKPKRFEVLKKRKALEKHAVSLQNSSSLLEDDIILSRCSYYYYLKRCIRVLLSESKEREIERCVQLS